MHLGIYMEKLCHKKMLILRCILPPTKKKIEPPPEKKINLPPPGKSLTPWQETQLTGNNFNPLKTLSLWKNISIPLLKNSNLQEKRHFKQPRKVPTIMKKRQPLHLKNFQSLQKLLTPSEKNFYSFGVTTRTPPPPPPPPPWENLNFTPPETI